MYVFPSRLSAISFQHKSYPHLTFLLRTWRTQCVLYPKGLGVKSKLYSKFMKEEVDLERECARYAIQALVATHFFRSKVRWSLAFVR